MFFADVEISRVERHFSSQQQVRGGSDARSLVISESLRCHTWHYPGHCHFNAPDPLTSTLHFGDENLTLGDVFGRMRLPENTLVVLSACESGLTRPDFLDEYVGFPAAFLFAGARCVVSSLWATDDFATLLLMDRFYRNWRGGLSIAAALREAQLFLREGIRSGPDLLEIVNAEFLESLASDDQRRVCRARAAYLTKKFPTDPPFAAVAYWAPFTASGMAFA